MKYKLHEAIKKLASNPKNIFGNIDPVKKIIEIRNEDSKMNLTNKQLKLVESVRQTLIDEQESDNPHFAHINADNALLELLKGLGFDDIVQEWEKVSKWYS